MLGLTSRWCRILTGCLLLLTLTAPAHAHMTVEGAGEFGNGALHPVMTPAHLLILIGLGLLLGQRVPLDLKLPLRVFGPVSLIALALTAAPWVGGIQPPVLSAIAMGIAILVALGKPLPRVVSALVCVAAAIGIGLDSGVETGTGWQIAKTLAGTWLAMNAIVCYLAICASHGAGKPWARTGIRVIGSWIVAIAVLLLAFSLRK